MLLLNAGHEASVNGMGNGWWTLFRHPDSLARLRAGRSPVPRALEELLRFDTPLQLFRRWVLEDVEVAGVPVPRGAELGLLFGSANRDPPPFSIGPTRSTSSATRIRTLRSAPAFTSAWGRRSHGWIPHPRPECQRIAPEL